MGCSNSSTKELIIFSNSDNTENNNRILPKTKSNEILIFNKSNSSKQSSFLRTNELRERLSRSNSILRVNKRKVSEYPMHSFKRKSTLVRSDKKSFTTRKQESSRKIERNGVIMVENIKEYLPKDLTQEMVYGMVEQALGGNVVEDESQVEKGKTITKKQLKAIAGVVFQHLKEENNTIMEEAENETNKQENNNNNNGSNIGEDNKQNKAKHQRPKKVRHSCINDLHIRVGMRDLTPSLLKKTYFRNQNVSQIQLDNAMKNFTQGTDSVKVLIIDIQ